MVKKETKKVSQEKRNLTLRSPIVAVLGHVDHGKTTLLDKIRQTHVAEKEAGQITQRIGAWEVEVNLGQEKKKITFIDTPGHEAFVKMRERGAQITDLAILVVAADDGVMPQTKESIKHLEVTKTPFLVALNKIDLPAANPEKVKKQLAGEGVLLEGLGGEIVCVPVSARTGQGIEGLLEMILLLAEMAGLEAKPQAPLRLAVVESRLDSRKGPVATVIVQEGTLRVGDTIELGGVKSRVRGMINDRGEIVEEAGPSMPVEILGLKEVPGIGETSGPKIQEEVKDETPKLKVILKADAAGSLEAIFDSLPQGLEIISSGVGEITESDILLAKTSGALVLGFNLRPSGSVKKLAETEGVLFKTYRIIYELLEEISEAISSLTAPQSEIVILGRAKIIAQFPFEKERVAGCQVIEGRVSRGDNAQVLRDKEEIGKAKIKSIRHLKTELPKAEAGTECGILLSPQLDFQPGDMLLSYKSREIPAV
ncbi:MAG: GTP-binding protein [bacterium]|nr:GTP-binding protein [bacterium]